MRRGKRTKESALFATIVFLHCLLRLEGAGAREIEEKEASMGLYRAW
jgi:hypothetical protein